MSYDNSANAVRRLEERFERLLLALGDMQAAIGRMQQPSYNAAGASRVAGGRHVYAIAPMAIAAAANSLAEHPQVLSRAELVCIHDWPDRLCRCRRTLDRIAGNLYGLQQDALCNRGDSGLPIIVGANPDGSFSVISQSC